MARSEQGIVTAVTGGRAGVADREATEPGRVIQRRAGLPGGRAVLGALLMALAAVGVFLAYTDASEAPADELVVATKAIHPGEQISTDDLRVLEGALPRSTRGGTFASIEEVVGRVALGPIDAGEIVQAGSLTSGRATTPAHEVALTLPRGQVAVGRLKEGERVDVFVTYEEQTTSVVRGAEVVQIATASDGSLTSDREIGIVVAVPTGDAVAALVHALRTGDVTVVRSTFAAPDEGAPLVYDAGGDASPAGTAETGSAGD